MQNRQPISALINSHSKPSVNSSISANRFVPPSLPPPPPLPHRPLPLQIAAIGESGILGFIEHLDSRAAAQLLAQTLTASSREQMTFRQYEGLFPVPVDFQTAITQSMMWTMLAPFILSCPAGNLVIEFQNFPGLNVVVRFFLSFYFLSFFPSPSSYSFFLQHRTTPTQHPSSTPPSQTTTPTPPSRITAPSPSPSPDDRSTLLKNYPVKR